MRPVAMIAALACFLSGPALAQPDLRGLADADGDGMVSEDEFTAYYDLVWTFLAADKPTVDLKQAHPLLRTMILIVLPKADGLVDREDMRDAAPTRALDADADKDGVLTLAELKAWKAIAPPAP